MRYAPLLPVRRPMFGRRHATPETEPVRPTREERKLAEAVMHHVGLTRPR
ncbi:hypothetical protein ACWKWJ_12795 [Sphingopyxis terrae subsp. ummariensis]